VIQQQLEYPLAKQILQGEFQPGDTIAVDAANGRLAFRKTA
jgi:ATP-dependent Clp protease ATP-binding subunit ClpB